MQRPGWISVPSPEPNELRAAWRVLAHWGFSLDCHALHRRCPQGVIPKIFPVLRIPSCIQSPSRSCLQRTCNQFTATETTQLTPHNQLPPSTSHCTVTTFSTSYQSLPTGSLGSTILSPTIMFAFVTPAVTGFSTSLRGKALCNATRVSRSAVSMKVSPAMPFMEQPATLDDETIAGNVGFDPLYLSEIFDLKFMQEAELKHCALLTTPFLFVTCCTFQRTPTNLRFLFRAQ